MEMKQKRLKNNRYNKTKIQISKGDDCFVITATDESGIDKVVIKRTSDNKSFTMKAKDNEKNTNVNSL